MESVSDRQALWFQPALSPQLHYPTPKKTNIQHQIAHSFLLFPRNNRHVDKDQTKIRDQLWPWMIRQLLQNAF